MEDSPVNEICAEVNAGNPAPDSSSANLPSDYELVGTPSCDNIIPTITMAVHFRQTAAQRLHQTLREEVARIIAAGHGRDYDEVVRKAKLLKMNLALIDPFQLSQDYPDSVQQELSKWTRADSNPRA